MNQTDMIYDLSLIWATVKEVFPYFDRLTFDWDALYRSCLDQVLHISNEADFHRLLTDFLDRLQDGHTRYLPPDAFRDTKASGMPEPPSCTILDNVLTIRINDFMTDHSAYVEGLLKANPDLVVLDIRDNIGGNTFYAAKVALLFLSGTFHGCEKWTQVRKAIAVASASQILRCSDEKLQKLIREGLLTEQEVSDARQEVSHTKYETYVDTYGSEDHIALYHGPMQLLISKKTMSAAEDFTAMFKSNHRATLIGEATCGSTGTPCLILSAVADGHRLSPWVIAWQTEQHSSGRALSRISWCREHDISRKMLLCHVFPGLFPAGSSGVPSRVPRTRDCR